MAQSKSSKLVDPFQGMPILSLHPRTFRDSKVSLKSNDLEAIHQHMSSMALQNPDKHFEEAKLIIDGGSEFVNTKENSEPNMKENENPQKNRPALARKRAKFSMKPDTSQPSTIVEPTFQMDQLHDPEDFFAAYEKFENTVKELKRQRGEDPNEPKLPTTARQRRPEIPRRKSSYQHHIYSSQPESDTLVSQETLQDTNESQPIQDSQQSVTPNCQSEEKEVNGSITKAEDRVNKLFDNLMSSNIADLDGDEALSYLKDCLKINHVAINDLQLPDFHDIPKVNPLSSVNLIKDQNLLPDKRSLSDNFTLGKQKKLLDKPCNPLSSPTPKSPFLAISAFGKLLSKSAENKSNDPFSACDMDFFPATSTHTSKDTEFPVSASEDNDLPISASKDDLSDREQRHNMEEVDEEMQTNVEDATAKVTSSSQPEENAEITTIDESENNCFHSAQTDDSFINVPDASLLLQNPDVVPEQQNEEHPKTSMNNLKRTRATSKVDPKNKRHSQAAQTDDCSINVPDASLLLQNPDVVPEQQNEEHPKTSINNRKRTRATNKVDPKKKRHSLAGGGSCWTGGVRRSNRIKSKPLEYWKGERLLYARVHNSLPTVVGVKYISSTDSNGFKVESFVSDEYKDLVDLVSLH